MPRVVSRASGALRTSNDLKYNPGGGLIGGLMSVLPPLLCPFFRLGVSIVTLASASPLLFFFRRCCPFLLIWLLLLASLPSLCFTRLLFRVSWLHFPLRCTLWQLARLSDFWVVRCGVMISCSIFLAEFFQVVKSRRPSARADVFPAQYTTLSQQVLQLPKGPHTAVLPTRSDLPK